MRVQTPPEEEKKKEVLPQSIDIHTLKHVLEYAQVSASTMSGELRLEMSVAARSASAKATSSSRRASTRRPPRSISKPGLTCCE